MKIPLDKVAEKVAALGVPGIILVVVISTTGVLGGAAIVVALATLGGPFGMLGGLAVLGILVLISNALAKYGIDKLMEAILRKMKEKEQSREEILKKIENCWFLSESRRQQIRHWVDEYYPRSK